jgi:hypothetical protein
MRILALYTEKWRVVSDVQDRLQSGGQSSRSGTRNRQRTLPPRRFYFSSRGRGAATLEAWAEPDNA